MRIKDFGPYPFSYLKERRETYAKENRSRGRRISGGTRGLLSPSNGQAPHEGAGCFERRNGQAPHETPHQAAHEAGRRREASHQEAHVAETLASLFKAHPTPSVRRAIMLLLIAAEGARK